MRKSQKINILLVTLFTAAAVSVLAGRVSLIVKGTKYALKAGAKEAAQQATKKMLLKRTEALTARYGRHTIERATEIAAKHNIRPNKMLRLLEDHGTVLARHNFSEEAFTFARQHGGSGVFFLRHDALYNGLKKSVEISKVDHTVIVQAWRWGDEKAIGGSMKRLREALTKAGMNAGRTRDFCEDLFMVKARSGKIPGIPKGAELIKGHVGDEFSGVDMYLPSPGQKLRAIEFGTGKKPGLDELSWDRIRDRLAYFLDHQSSDGRINLRGSGFPPELVNNPARIRSPDFPIEKYVQREVYANEINRGELAKAGTDIIAHELK